MTAATAETVVCSMCLDAKPVTDFARDNQRRTGRRSACKACANARQRANRKRSPKQRNTRYLPVGPLRAAFKVTILDIAHRRLDENAHTLPLAQAEAELFGVATKTVLRWNKEPDARIYMTSAETICHRLGVYPSQIWGDLYWEVALADPTASVV